MQKYKLDPFYLIRRRVGISQISFHLLRFYHCRHAIKADDLTYKIMDIDYSFSTNIICLNWILQLYLLLLLYYRCQSSKTKN